MPLSVEAGTDIVDLSRYPLTDPGSAAYAALTERARAQLRSEGACVLPGFLSESGLAQVLAEAVSLIPQAFHNVVTGNAYLDEPESDLPEGHARKMTDTTALAVIAYDQIPKTTAMRRLYEWDGFLNFTAACVGRGPLYRYACPMGAMNVSVMRSGDYLRWHFDQSDFVVSIPLQDAEYGGEFEYVRNLRSPEDPRFDAVKKVLAGERDGVKTLSLPPGSLVLFQGRNTLHRVTLIKGNTPRLGLLLGYVDTPGATSSDYLRTIRYGRTS